MSSETAGFNISAGKLFEQTSNDVKTLQSVLRDMNQDEARDLLTNFNRIGAVLESSFIDAAPEIRQTLGRALEGGVANQDAIRAATLLTGKSMEDLRKDLVSGDLDGLFANIGRQIEGMDPAAIRSVADVVGIGADQLVKMRDAQDEMNAGFQRSAQFIVPVGEGMQELTTRAEQNRTAFEKLQERFTDAFGTLALGGITGVEVLDFFKEFNATTLLSLGFLAKWTVQGVGGAIGALGKLGGALGAGVGGLQSLAGGGSFSAGASAAGAGRLGKLGRVAGRAAGVGALLTTVALATDFLTRPEDEVGNRTADAAGQQAAATRQQADFEKRRAKFIDDQLKGVPAEARGRIRRELDRFVSADTSFAAISEKIAALAAAPPPQASDLAQVTTPLVTPSQIDAVVAGMTPPMLDQVGVEDKLDRNNELLAMMVTELRRMGSSAVEPTPATLRGPTEASSTFARGVARGEF